MIFDIPKSIFDNTESFFSYHKFDFVILKNHNDFVISENLLCDMIKSNMWYHNFNFLILQNQFLLPQN